MQHNLIKKFKDKTTKMLKDWSETKSQDADLELLIQVMPSLVSALVVVQYKIYI